MGDDVDVDVLLFGRIKEREVGGGPLTFAFEGNYCILGALALHLHIVGGRVNGFHRHLGIELHVDHQILNRFGGILGRIQREGVAHQTGVIFEHLIVGESNGFLAVRFEGEDAYFK